jgi:hypothetical protein
MLIKKTFAGVVVLALLSGNILAQQVVVPIAKPAEISPELRKNAIDLLRETIKEIPNLKAEENRQFFTIETGRLLWKYDEKESRRMIAEVIREFNKSHREIIRRVRQANIPLNDPPYNSRKINKPLNWEELRIRAEGRRSMRIQGNLLLWLISADPEIAAQFVAENSDLNALPGDRGYYSSVRPRIVEALLEKDKVEKSLEIAREMLSQEFSASYLDVLRRIYQKDEIKGRELAEETHRKVLSAPAGYKVSTYHLYHFFERAADSAWGSSDGMLSEKSMTELAGLLGKTALTKYDVDNSWVLEQIARVIQKYSPQQALQIRRALRTKPASIVNQNAANTTTDEYWGWTNSYPSYPANSAANAANWVNTYRPMYVNAASNVANSAANAAWAAAEAANKAANGPARVSRKPRRVAEPVEPPKSQWEIKQERKAYLLEKLRNGEFTVDEKKKFIQDLKDLVHSENSYAYLQSDRYIQVVETLSRLAMVSSDREIVQGLMAEAEIYVRPQPRTYADYVSKLFLAMGYSATDPKKSFAVMESLGGINEVFENMVKFAEFMDDTGELVIGREMNARVFLQERGGIRDILQKNDFWLFLRNLSQADFQRTKGIADKFERRELKSAARLWILESLLGDPKGDSYY